MPSISGNKRQLSAALRATSQSLAKSRKVEGKVVVMEFMESNPQLVDTLAYVCSSGLLTKLDEDLQNEQYLPPSNKFLHHVSRTFLGHVLCKMEPSLLSTDLLCQLYEKDDAIVNKMLYFATGLNRNWKLPIKHKNALMDVLVKHYTNLGKRLASWPWSQIKTSYNIDWQKIGAYRLVVENGTTEVKSVQHISGLDVGLTRPVTSAWQFINNHDDNDVSLIDPSDDDIVHIGKRMKALGLELSLPSITDTLVQEALAQYKGAGAERPAAASHDAVAAVPSGGGSNSSSNSRPECPQITPIKVPRRAKGTTGRE